MSKKVPRLYKQFQPSSYDIQCQPDRENMTFTGKITIEGQKVGRPSQRLTFHQKNLKFTKVQIIKHRQGGEPQQIAIERINTHNRFDEVRLHSKQMLYPGLYTVTLEYRGAITRPMNGMYPCYFKLSDIQKVIIATQFESHHAREAFPCIDEPEAKATFTLTLTTPKGETVIANTPIAQQTSKKAFMVTRFQTTPKMSTYLLAFVYGELEYLEAKTKNGTIVRTYATPDNVAHTKFALDIGVRCLEFFNDYFELDYPLPKCDLVALPDFSNGAMENWGCITFREQALFVDPQNTSLYTKQFVAMVVAHELAHQWFGNLVTMKWWTDLWLNEGFASWIEYLAVDHLFPDWQMWTQFVVSEQEPALKLDGLDNTHPIEVVINHPDEINSIFDTISYNKGSSLIRMLQQYLGAENFRRGLCFYLKEHLYGNTDTLDLWTALEQMSHKPVKEFMHAWTTQPGFPFVRATITNLQLTLRQERFFVHSSKKVPRKSADTWPIPLHPSQEITPSLSDVPDLKISLPKNNKPLLLNQERSGFYRVTYDPRHLQSITKQVQKGTVSPLDRLGLLSDNFEAAKAGHTETTEVLKLLKAYVNEDNNVVWDVIVGIIASIRGVMDDEALRETLKPYVRKLTALQLKRLGWEHHSRETYFDSLLRPTILSLAAHAEEPKVVKVALQKFQNMRRSEDVEPDLRGVVYGTAARLGSAAEFEKLLKLHNSSDSSEERLTLSVALVSFKQPELVERALTLIDSNTVRLQDVSYWVAYSFMNRFARLQTWDWMTTHWDWLDQNLGSDLSFFRIPVYAARVFSDQEFLATFKAFFEQHETPALERPIKQGVEIIQWQSAWRKRDLKKVKKYFKT